MGTFRANSLANPTPPFINVFSTHILRQLSRKPIPSAGEKYFMYYASAPLINVFSSYSFQDEPIIRFPKVYM